MKNSYSKLILVGLLFLGSIANSNAQNYYIYGASELTTTDARYPNARKFVMRVFAYKGTGGSQTNYLSKFMVDFSYDSSKLKNPEYFVWKGPDGPVLPVNNSYSLTQGVYTITPGSDLNYSGSALDDGTNSVHHNMNVASGGICSSALVTMVHGAGLTVYEVFRIYFDIKESSPPTYNSGVYYDPSVTGALLVPGPGNITPQNPAVTPTSSPASPPWVVYTYTDVNSDWEICNNATGTPKPWNSSNAGGLVFGFGAPLPVSLTKFTAVKSNNDALLQWTTAQEMNNDYFTVEHSVDGKLWNAVGTIKGAGTSSNATSYSFTHNNTFKGLNFYRLKQVAFNGSVEYSAVKIVSNDLEVKGLNIFPNPASQQATIVYASELGSKSQVTVTDAFGKTIYNSSIENMVTLNTKNLVNGIYFVRILDAGNSFTQKLVIQKD